MASGPTTLVAEPKIPKKEKGSCPLGEKGIGGGFGVFSFELSCYHVRISGGGFITPSFPVVGDN